MGLLCHSGDQRLQVIKVTDESARGFRQLYLKMRIHLLFFFWLQLECKFHVFVVTFIESMFVQPWHMGRAPY